MEEKLKKEIFIYPVKDLNVNAVHNHFKSFGKIKYMTGCLNKSYCTIRFENPESAKNASIKRNQNIYFKNYNQGKEYNIAVTVEAPLRFLDDDDDDDHNDADNHTGLIPPDADSPLNIMNKLNDDLFIDIFENLSLRDLCAAAEVCPQFKINAQHVFPRRYSHLKFVDNTFYIYRILIEADGEVYYDYPYQISFIKSLFQNFGSKIKSIDTYGNVEILKLIAKFCLEEKSLLTKLTFSSGLEFDKENILQPLQLVFSRLNSLDIRIHGPKSETLLKACRELRELKLNDSAIITDDVIAQVLQSNPKLKRFEFYSRNIFEVKKHVISWNIYRYIGMYSTELEYLKIGYENIHETQDPEQTFAPLRQLKHLKILELNCPSTPFKVIFDALADGNVLIEELTLVRPANDSESAISLSRLSKIQKLKIFSIENGFEMGLAISGMPLLNHLEVLEFEMSMSNLRILAEFADKLEHLECSFSFQEVNKEDYYELVRLIKNRENGIPLKISNYAERGHWFSEDFPYDEIERNRQWLKIDCPSGGISDWESEKEDIELLLDYEPFSFLNTAGLSLVSLRN